MKFFTIRKSFKKSAIAGPLAVVVFACAFSLGLLTITKHNEARAADVPVKLLIGGIQGFVLYCGCSENWLVTVGPPRPGTFIIEEPLTLLFEFYMQFVPGAWQLGYAYPPGICSVYIYFGCVTITAMGTEVMDGTSLVI